MRRLIPLLALLALAAGGAAGAVAAPAGWVVGVEGPSALALAHDLRAEGARVRRIPRLGALEVRGAPAAALRGIPGVAYVEPVRERRLLTEPGDAVDPATGRPFTWALDAVRARAALATLPGGAPDVPVAVVDSGVDAGHPDLAGRVRTGRDVVGDGTTADLAGHGTFVAALVSGIDGNGAGGRGVAGATPIIPVRVTLGGSISSADLAAGIVAALDAGARVINLSLGGPGFSEVERSAIDLALARDVVVVASAGNEGDAGNPLIYPAAYVGGEDGGWGPGLSVAATDPLDRPVAFSTSNRFVTVAAPGAGLGCGDGVYSAIPAGAVSLWPGPCAPVFAAPAHGPGRYAYGEGTSFSAPLVAGAAALVRQARPSLRAEQVAHVIRRTARRSAGAGWNPRTGAGVLDAGAAVALARRYDTLPPEVVATVEPVPGGVRLRASASDRAAPGEELAGGVTLTVARSDDGTAFAPLLAPAGGPVDVTVPAAPGERRWFRATACDANRNCAVRAAGPAGPGSASPAARRPASPGARILAFGRPARCGAGASACLRLTIRAAPGAAGPVRYAIVVRELGRRAVVGRARGLVRAGRRHHVTVRLRGPVRCGRVVARLELRSAGVRSVAVRRAAVRRSCTPPR